MSDPENKKYNDQNVRAKYVRNSYGIPTKFISDRLSESRRVGLEPDYNLDSGNSWNSLEYPRRRQKEALRASRNFLFFNSYVRGPFGPPEKRDWTRIRVLPGRNSSDLIILFSVARGTSSDWGYNGRDFSINVWYGEKNKNPVDGKRIVIQIPSKKCRKA